jgi:hypothetical protein
MEPWKLSILAVVVGGVVLALWINQRSRRQYRPLAARFVSAPDRPEPGMEATDLEAVQGIVQRNAALARKTGPGGGAASWTEVGARSNRPGSGNEQNKP